MTCPSCSNPLEVQTDPQNRDYVCITGLKRRTYEYEASEDLQLEKIAQGPNAPVNDPFQKLESKKEDEEFAQEKFPHLTDLIELSARTTKNDYQNARMLRAQMRKQSKEIQSLRDEAKTKSLSIELLPGTSEDRVNALKLTTTAQSRERKEKETRKAERFKVRTGSIFSTPATMNSPIGKHGKSNNSNSSALAAASLAKRKSVGVGQIAKK